MHLKIIFIGLNEKILFNKGILENIEDAYKKIYYKINNYNVEALFFDSNYDGISKHITNGSIIVANDVGSLKVEHIESIKNNKDIVFVFGKREKTLVRFEREFIFPYLLKNDKVEIYDIILTIYNIFKYENIEKRIYKTRGIIGFSNSENLQQNLVMDVLNNFKLIEKCQEYNLDIFANEETNIAELAYIEDPLKEYMYMNSNFKINQIIDERYKEKIYYSMFAV